MNEFEVLKLQVEAWKTTVDVQKHFNDIEMKIRALAITVLTAVVGAAAVATKDKTIVELGQLGISLAGIILMTGFFAWMLFYFVDQVWYHRLLLGAVKHGEDLETILGRTLDGFKLSQAIRTESPYQIKFFGKDVFDPIRSTTKLRVFYWCVGVLLLFGAVLVQVGAT